MSPIVAVPEPVLRQTAKPVTTYDKRIQSILADMEKTLLAAKNPEGVGLAAPQIGLSLRIFLIKPGNKSTLRVFINPEIIELSDEQQSPSENDGVYEGCLSLPGHYSPLTRSLSLKLKYDQVENNQLVSTSETFTGFTAHIIQHELDHLNGVLFIDRVLEQDQPLFRVKGKKWEQVNL